MSNLNKDIKNTNNNVKSHKKEIEIKINWRK